MRTAPLLAGLLLAACKDPPPPAAVADDLRVETYAATTADGELAIPVEVEEGDVFQVVVHADTEDYAFGRYDLFDPSGDPAYRGEVWATRDEVLTGAVWTFSWASTLGWPVREQDGPLAPGTWSVVVRTATGEAGGFRFTDDPVDVNVTISRRNREDLSKGALHLRVAYTGGLEEDAEVVRTTEAAAERVAALYADVGIAVTATYTTLDADAAFVNDQRPIAGVAELAGAADPRAIVVLVGDEFDVNGMLGLTYTAPGPFAVETGTAAVRVGWLELAGADAAMSERELSTYGTVMAHEVGHYLGLPHPVESTYDTWDALEDTVECTEEAACDAVFLDNLMSWAADCAGSLDVDCVQNERLTPDQFGVMQRYVGVTGGAP